VTVVTYVRCKRVPKKKPQATGVATGEPAAGKFGTGRQLSSYQSNREGWSPGKFILATSPFVSHRLLTWRNRGLLEHNPSGN
jgi:hypothetical protein